jgi:acetylornithine aminotransferase
MGGFVFEPGGSSPYFVHFPPQKIVRALAEMVSRQDGCIVVNEITTGMGRTGRWFGYQHYELQPDIVVIGKGLGNGYPVSAVAVSGDLARKSEASGFHYAQSHQNDPLGCAVVREVITTLREGGLIERGRQIGGRFLEELQHLAQEYELVKDARGRGMLLAVEFQPHENLSVTRAYNELLKSGYLVGYYPAGNILRFDPALTIDKQDLSYFIEAFQHFLESNHFEN